jgi:3-oxoacyl-[acyl-carrier protein] reductase
MRTALVTGASRGIGRSIAERLAVQDVRVIVHYGTNKVAADDTVAAIERVGGQAIAIQAELGLAGDIDKLFAALEPALAGRPLDILINNAGILDFTPLEHVTEIAFDRSFAINVKAPFFIVQRALPLMADGGRIINVSSAATRVASAFIPYAMTKGALEIFGRSLAQLLGERGITVNIVSPGVVRTDMGAWVDNAEGLEESVISTTALGRLGMPADIADVVCFLASPQARWVTGVNLDVSGGIWLGPKAS